MNISVEKVQFENDDDSLSFLNQHKIDTKNKRLQILKVCGDVMYLIYHLPSLTHSSYVIQKISLNEPDVVITMRLIEGKNKSVKDYLFNKITQVFKIYNESVASDNQLLLKTEITQENGIKYYYYLIKNASHDTIVPLSQLNKRNLDISAKSNLFDKCILLGTKNGKIFHYNFSTDTLVKLNQFSAPVQGLHYENRVLTIVVGVTIMRYLDITDILKFGVECIPKEIENYGSEFTKDNDEDGRLNAVKVIEDLYTGGYAVNYADELVVNNYGESIAQGNVLLKQLFFNGIEVIDYCLSKYHLICITDNNQISIINQLNTKKKFVSKLEDVDGQLLGLDVDYFEEDGEKRSTYWLFDESNNAFEIILEEEYKDVIDDLVHLDRYKEALAFELKDYALVQDIYNKYFSFLIKEKDCDIDELVEVGGKIHDNFTIIISSLVSKIQGKNKNDFVITKIVNLLKSRLKYFNTKLTANQNKIYLSFILHLLTQLDGTTLNDKLIREFLVQNSSKLDVGLAKNLLAESPNNLVFYLKLIKDFKSLIHYHLSKNNNFIEAIKTISVYCNDANVVYETAEILLMNCPEDTVKTWIKLIMSKILTLDIEPLLKSLLKYFHNIYQVENMPNKKNHALWFLSWFHATYNSNNKVINNHIVYMLILDNNNYDVDRVLSFINDNWENLDQFLLLNLAERNSNPNKIDIIVYILNKLQMYEESIKLCLQEGLFDTAKDVIGSIDYGIDENGNDFNNVVNLKKTLWLLFAKHTVAASYNNKMNLKPIISDLIHDSGNILTTIDIFPIIKTLNVTVAVIKDEFINNLNHENKLLTETNKEIENLINLKQKILKDIDYLTLNYHQEIYDDDVCHYCHDNLILKKKFYCFPCSHKLHVNCILEMILKGGDFALKNHVEMIMYKKSSRWLDELNTLLGKKCPICTDININNIDEPFTLDLTVKQELNGGVANSSIDYLQL